MKPKIRIDCPWHGRKFNSGDGFCTLHHTECKPTDTCTNALDRIITGENTFLPIAVGVGESKVTRYS